MQTSNLRRPCTCDGDSVQDNKKENKNASGLHIYMYSITVIFKREVEESHTKNRRCAKALLLFVNVLPGAIFCKPDGPA